MSKFTIMENALPYFQMLLYAAEWLAALTGFLYWKNVRQSYWQWFPFYLLFIAVAETINHRWGAKLAWLPGYFFPLVVIPTEFIFIGWLFSKQSSAQNRSWLFIASLLLYIAALLLEQCCLTNKLLWFDFFSYSIGNILLLIIIIHHFTRFLLSREVLLYKQNRMFWISIGLFLFYFGSFPFFGFGNKLYQTDPAIAYGMYYGVCILGIFMYLLFAYSFRCRTTK